MLKQSLHSGFFYAAYTLSRVLLAVVLGKAMRVEEYGVYSLITAAIVVLVGFLPLHADQYLMREVPGRSPQEAAMLFKSVIGIQSLWLGLLMLIFMFVGPVSQVFMRLIGSPGKMIFSLMIGAIVFLESVACECVRYLYARQRIEIGNLASFFQTSGWAVALFLIFLFKPQAVQLSTVLGVWCLSLLVAVAYGLHHSDFGELWKAPVRPAFYRAAVVFGAPIVLSNALQLAQSFGRFLSAGHHNTAAVGVFVYHLSLVLLVGGLSSPLVGAPLDPYIVEAHNLGQSQRSRRLLNVALRYRLMIAVPFLIVAALWSQPLIEFVARKDYAVVPWLILCLVPIPLVMTFASTYERILFLRRRTDLIGRSYLIAGAIQVLISLFAIPWHAYYGFALSANAGAFALVACFKHYVGHEESAVRAGLWRLAIAAVPCAAATTLVGHWLQPMTSWLFTTIVTLVALLSYSVSCFVVGAVFVEEKQILWRSFPKALHWFLPVKAGRVAS
jgi:O-antigen/teichoic acid export membrane protein